MTTSINERLTQPDLPEGILAAECLTRAPSSVAGLFRCRCQQVHVQPSEVILLHGETADRLYEIVSGTVRCCTFTEDGRRQIFRFAYKRGFLGFVDLETWHFTAEAVDHVILNAVSRDYVERQIETNGALQRSVRALVADELAARERQLITVAYLQADERLLLFLAEFAGTRQTDGFITLPMIRQDIADHLGMTLETVCRAFGVLKRNGTIEMCGSDKFRLITEPVPLAA